MKQEIVLHHQFVEFIPDELEEKTIYVSIRFATASHSCLCGCGNKVVTPIRPTDWTLIFDGKTISLDPSIGNWSFPCQSHYWIRKNRGRWTPKWSREQIEYGRGRDSQAKQRYFGDENYGSARDVRTVVADTQFDRPNRRFWRRLKWW
jgi:hypothetical protein